MSLPDTEDGLARSLTALGLHPGPAELRKLTASPVGSQVARLLATPVAPQAHNAGVFAVPDPSGPDLQPSGGSPTPLAAAS